MRLRKLSLCLVVAALAVATIATATGQAAPEYAGWRAGAPRQGDTPPQADGPRQADLREADLREADGPRRGERLAVSLENRLAADSGFAGVYLGRGQRPTLSATSARLADRARAMGAEVRMVDVPLDVLDDARRRLQRAVGRSGYAVVDISENNVYVYPPSSGLGAVARHAVERVRRSGVVVKVQEPVRALKKPYLGAVGISHTRGNRRTVCAGAFNVKNRGGHPMVVTAGHCGRVKSAWYKLGDGGRVGRITRRSFQRVGRNDWALIRSSRTYRHPAAIRHGRPSRFRVKDVRRLGGLREGKGMCRKGTTTHTRCGRITHISPGHFFRSGVCARHGDSGGPAYHRIPRTDNVVALGILSGGSGVCGDKGSYTIYQPLREVLRKENLTLRTRR